MRLRESCARDRLTPSTQKCLAQPRVGPFGCLDRNSIDGLSLPSRVSFVPKGALQVILKKTCAETDFLPANSALLLSIEATKGVIGRHLDAGWSPAPDCRDMRRAPHFRWKLPVVPDAFRPSA